MQFGTHQLRSQPDEESTIKYDEFKAVANNNKWLTWEFTELSNSVNF